MILGTILLLLAAGTFLTLGINASFSAHLQEKTRDLWLTHLYSFALMICGIGNLFLATRLWS